MQSWSTDWRCKVLCVLNAQQPTLCSQAENNAQNQKQEASKGKAMLKRFHKCLAVLAFKLLTALTEYCLKSSASNWTRPKNTKNRQHMTTLNVHKCSSHCQGTPQVWESYAYCWWLRLAGTECILWIIRSSCKSGLLSKICWKQVCTLNCKGLDTVSIFY